MVTIVASGVSKRYRKRTVLHPMSFSAERGTITALVGPNGAGKTTLLRRMTGIIRGGGTTTFDGQRWCDLKCPRKTVGLYLGASPFHSGIRVADHMRLVAASVSGADSRIADVLERFELSEHRATRIARLSMGMRQRLGLASALLADPPVLLLDEPFSALDPAEASAVYRWLAELARDRGRTIILSTHQLERIEPFATHAIFLRDGRSRAQGALDEIATELQLPPVVHLAVTDPLALVGSWSQEGPSVQLRSGGVVTISAEPDEALTMVRRHGVSVRALWSEPPGLSVVYQELM